MLNTKTSPTADHMHLWRQADQIHREKVNQYHFLTHCHYEAYPAAKELLSSMDKLQRLIIASDRLIKGYRLEVAERIIQEALDNLHSDGFSVGPYAARLHALHQAQKLG